MWLTSQVGWNPKPQRGYQCIHRSICTAQLHNINPANMHATKIVLLHGINVAMMHYTRVASAGAESTTAQYTLSKVQWRSLAMEHAWTSQVLMIARPPLGYMQDISNDDAMHINCTACDCKQPKCNSATVTASVRQYTALRWHTAPAKPLQVQNVLQPTCNARTNTLLVHATT